MSYKNYHNDYVNLNNWLSHVPNYEPRETDDLKQVETKLRNQRVGVIYANIFLLTVSRERIKPVLYFFYRTYSLILQKRNLI